MLEMGVEPIRPFGPADFKSAASTIPPLEQKIFANRRYPQLKAEMQKQNSPNQSP